MNDADANTIETQIQVARMGDISESLRSSLLAMRAWDRAIVEISALPEPAPEPAPE